MTSVTGFHIQAKTKKASTDEKASLKVKTIRLLKGNLHILMMPEGTNGTNDLNSQSLCFIKASLFTEKFGNRRITCQYKILKS